MATYNKRGYKSPKPKDVQDIEENADVDVKDSTTAEVFSTLDEGAFKTEEWVARNQKYIFSVVGIIALVTAVYLLYDRYVLEPKQVEAADEMFLPQQHFMQAMDATAAPSAKDSLLTLSLNGADGKFGFLRIIEEYSGTDAANLAQYYAGVAYLNLGKNTEAISHLDQFKSKDMLLAAQAKGNIGDAFAQKNQLKEALEYYEKAAKTNPNDITTPRYLFKAGQTAYLLGEKEAALKFFTEIKEKYETAPEARNIDGLIGMVQ